MSRWERPDPDLGAYFRMLRQHVLVLAVFAALGMAVGAGYQAVQGTPTKTNQAVIVRPAFGQGLPGADDFTLDTEAQLVQSEPVLEAIRTAVGGHVTHATLLQDLTLSVVSNSRILLVQFQYPDPGKAQAGVAAASSTYLKVRAELLAASRARALAALNRRDAQLGQQFEQTRQTLEKAGSAVDTRLRKALVRLSYQDRYVSTTSAQLTNAVIDPGEKLGRPIVKQNFDGWIVKSVSGGLLGLCAGFILCWNFEGALTRVRRWQRRGGSPELPVLGTVSLPSTPDSLLTATAPAFAEARVVLGAYAPVAGVMAVGKSARVRDVAATLSDALTAISPEVEGSRVVLVASPRTRAQEMLRMRDALETARQRVVGVLIVDA